MHVHHYKILVTPSLTLICMVQCRSTPVEVLHTLLLGPYKYLLGKTMNLLSASQKKEILACISSFNHSGFTARLTSNVTRYSQSFVGRDFKLWAQIAAFILKPYLAAGDLELWIALFKCTLQALHSFLSKALYILYTFLRCSVFVTLPRC